jgi:flagellar L-ring protein precursor FlgH
MNQQRYITTSSRYALFLALVGLAACSTPIRRSTVNPAKLYADSVRQRPDPYLGQQRYPAASAQYNQAALKEILPLGTFTSVDNQARGRLRFVSDDLPAHLSGNGKGTGLEGTSTGTGGTGDEPPQFIKKKKGDVNGEQREEQEDPRYTVQHSTQEFQEGYGSPLQLGEPGVSSSLWKEGRGSNDLWRDVRAWQPMDLITIVVQELAEGQKFADTEVKQKSAVELAIENIFGLENAIETRNDGPTSKIDTTALVNATTQNDFRGEGRTNRRDSLNARMSAMVAEVLPSGILRIEGQKIISMNSEEQVMVISGLVRQRDITSTNEVNSSRIANMRIDYYGNGTVDDAQHGGWAGRLLRTLWPF